MTLSSSFNIIEPYQPVKPYSDPAAGAAASTQVQGQMRVDHSCSHGPSTQSTETSLYPLLVLKTEEKKHEISLLCLCPC